MPGLNLNDEQKTEALKSALWYSVGNTIDALAMEQNINATPEFIGALTEMVWNQIHNASQDVEAFTKHAGRKVIDLPDVMLLTRRNDSLAEFLQSKMDAAKIAK